MATDPARIVSQVRDLVAEAVRSKVVGPNANERATQLFEAFCNDFRRVRSCLFNRGHAAGGEGQQVDAMLAEDRRMLTAVLKEKARIATGVEFIVKALRQGGRLFFVGAGTSGRLGVLESAEMPPTFSTDPALVQAIMAGGQTAIFKTKEGVEDNYEEGARSVMRLRPTKRDVVVGVSAKIGRAHV